MSLLSDDNPFIQSCGHRFGVDVIRDGETYKIRSAHILQHADYFSERRHAGGGTRPPNYYTSHLKDVLRIAVSLENLAQTFDVDKEEALSIVRSAMAAAHKSGETVPILVSKQHAFWAKVATPDLSKDGKVDFLLVRDPSCPSLPPPPTDGVEITVPTSEEDEGEGEGKEDGAPPVPPPPKRPRPGSWTHHPSSFTKVKYHGQVFDDDDEARHACLLDHLRIPYVPQPCSVASPLLINKDNVHGVYRTDFLLPSLGAYLETTQAEPSARKVFACELLARKAHAEGREVYLAHGGMHPPRRDTYSDAPQVMRITKFLVEEHVFSNGVRELQVVADEGYAWVADGGEGGEGGGGGAYRIRKLGSSLDRRWDHPNLRAALSLARGKVFDAP